MSSTPATLARPTRPQVLRLLAAGYRAVLLKASVVYLWEKGGRIYSPAEALRMAEGRITITTEFLNAGRGAGGDYTPAQLALLGVDWPPPRGWRSSVKGLTLSAEDADAFLELKDHGQRDLF